MENFRPCVTKKRTVLDWNSDKAEGRKAFRWSTSGQDSCSLANSEKLITEEVGKGDGIVGTDTSDTSNTTDTSDTLTTGEGGSWRAGDFGAGGDAGGGWERLSATTFAAPGVWWRSLVISEI